MLTSVSLLDLDAIPEPTLIHVLIELEIEPPIWSHIQLMRKEREFQFFDLKPTLELKLTLEPKVDFSELVLVPKLFISEPKSSIPQNHILLLDISIEHNNS